MATEGWQAGDLAVCITGDDTTRPPLIKGQIMRIKLVVPISYLSSGIGLAFHELPFFYDDEGIKEGYCSSLFRKIKPDNKACDAEFAARIKKVRELI